MKHVPEKRLALYAWGDLAPQDQCAIAAHIQSCRQCRAALSEFQETQNLVTTSLQNPEANELSEIRARLTAKLQSRQSSGSPWSWWGAAVAAALALLVLPNIVEHRPSVIQNAKPVEVSPVLAANLNPGPSLRIPLTPIASLHPRRTRSQKAGIRAVTLILQADWEPVIKMTTADPDVVILWQANKRVEQ